MDGDKTGIPGGRIKGETTKQFHAFTLYREMGPTRALSAVARELKCTLQNVARWSSANHWVERVAEWDDFADLKERERDILEREQAVTRMNRDQGNLGRAAQIVASRKLASYEAENETPEAQARAAAAVEALSAGEAATLMREGAKLERLAKGESTERLEVREAQKWVDRLLPIAMTYMPEDSHEAFLTDVEAVLGLGTGVGVPDAGEDD